MRLRREKAKVEGRYLPTLSSTQSEKSGRLVPRLWFNEGEFDLGTDAGLEGLGTEQFQFQSKILTDLSCQAGRESEGS